MRPRSKSSRVSPREGVVRIKPNFQLASVGEKTRSDEICQSRRGIPAAFFYALSRNSSFMCETFRPFTRKILRFCFSLIFVCKVVI